MPVVACRVAAIPEVVQDGITGLLTAPRAPGELAAAIERLIADPALARGMGREGRRRALGFTPRHVAERFLHAVHSSQQRLGQQARGG
jgi:glycosyltransferase involved in cell wall biosynthesis